MASLLRVGPGEVDVLASPDVAFLGLGEVATEERHGQGVIAKLPRGRQQL